MGHKGVSKRKPKQDKANQASTTAISSGYGASKDAVKAAAPPAQAVEKNKAAPGPAVGNKPPTDGGKKPKKR